MKINHQRQQNLEITVKKRKTSVLRYITAISYQLKTNCGKAIAIVS